MKKKDRTATAWHEAGHAVCSVNFKIPFKYATIEPDFVDRSWGHVKYEGESCFQGMSRNHREGIAISAYAGGLAEKKYLNQKPFRNGLKNLPIGASQDREDAMAALNERLATDEENLAYAEWIYHRAIRFVYDEINWQSIQAVALELIDKKRLTRREVRKIVLKIQREFMEQFGLGGISQRQAAARGQFKGKPYGKEEN